MKRLIICALALTLTLAVGQAQADVYRVDGTPEYILGVTNSEIATGAGAGMTVTAVFWSHTETAIWQATGPTSGSATGTGWSLSYISPSWYHWFLTTTITNDHLSKIYIDSFPGNCVFDTISGMILTPNSGEGWAEFDQPRQMAIYYSRVDILGDPTVYGDLYRILELRFDPSLVNESVHWNMDLDYVAIPLPGSLLLLGSGLVGLAGWRYRGRKG